MTSFEGSDYYDCNKKDKISIEPRLLEYINKKKYYKQNSIESDTLERDYNISDYDKLRIKAYLKGDRDKNLRFQDYVDTSQSYFPSDLLKADPRFDRIKKKQQKTKEAQQQRHNYGDISDTYDMYRNDRPFASAFGDDFRQSDFHPRDWFNDNQNVRNSDDWYQNAKKLGVGNWFQNTKDIDAEDYNKYALKQPHVRRGSGKHRDFNQLNTYEQPHSRYNGRLPYGNELPNNNSIDSILGEMNTMHNKYDRMEQRENEFDYEYNTIKPNVRGRKGFSQENSYNQMPYMGGMRGERDTSVENFVKFGSLTRGTKSNGYPNPVNHYFDYITPDIQDARHVVMDRGLPSRSLNREKGSSYRRDMMM